ncbi:MAG: hypothetical protein LC648_06535 [Novosphingobium sp.]|nr:hypothetical protein [Novosphingobium sp.]
MKPTMLKLASVATALALALALASPTLAQPQLSAPVATPIVQTVPDAADTPYPGGTMRLEIDATDVQRGVYRVRQTVPVAPGTRRLILQFPRWLPGNHGPRGPLAELVDLRFLVGGKPVVWRRDPVEVNAFHVELPPQSSGGGAREVVATFLHTSPLQTSEGRITMTQEMLNLQWEKMSLYPAGHYVRQIRVKPSVTFPAGFTAATALDGQSARGGRVSWDETTYEILVDSPIFAGKHYRKWDLGNRVSMHVVADTPDLIALRPEHEAKLRAMVSEAIAAFGSRAFDRYEFLVALTDRMGGIGLEHHRSSENQLEPRNFVEWDAFDWDRNVLAHELAHSWDGKFRRPAALWTPDYREPMRDTLLWVYEGQTQFWGNVIAARSGLQRKETLLGAIATQAGAYAELPGRGWRSVEDTTYDPVFAARKPKPYQTLARGEDYYNEGMLVDKSLSLTHSLGVGLDKDGKVTSTQWNGPAFNAGIVNGAKIVAVNGETYTTDRLKAAIAAKRPVELIVQRGERMLTVPIDYRGGLRWPWLEKVGSGEGGLDRLLAPKVTRAN